MFPAPSFPLVRTHSGEAGGGGSGGSGGAGSGGAGSGGGGGTVQWCRRQYAMFNWNGTQNTDSTALQSPLSNH